MSTKRGKQKETVEEDFEAFVRHQLSSISLSQVAVLLCMSDQAILSQLETTSK